MFSGRIKIFVLCFLLIGLCSCAKTTSEEDLFPDHYVASSVACGDAYSSIGDIRTVNSVTYLLASASDQTGYTLCIYDQEARKLTALGELSDNIQEARLGSDTVVTIQGNSVVEYDYTLKEVSSTAMQITPQHIAAYNDTVYVSSENIVYSLPEGSEFFHMDAPIDTMYLSSSGIVLTWWENDRRMAGILDTSGTLSKSVEIGQMALIFCGNETYHPQGSSIYAFDWTSREDIPKFSLSDCNIESSNIKAIEQIGDKQYLLAFTQPKVSRLQFALVEATDDTTQRLKTITIGTIAPSVEDVDSLIVKDIEQFNAENFGIKAELALYRNETELQLSLVSGDGPDILDLDSVDRDTYAAAGVLTDLLPWIEKDPDLEQDDFVQSWLNVMMTDGHLYGLYPSILVRTLVASRSDVTGEYGWSLEKFQNTISALPEDTSVIWGRSAQDILGMVLSYNLNNFIDFQNYTCNFCTEEFYEILELS